MQNQDRPDGVRVGVFVGHFLPAYRAGGPVRSLSAITAPRDSGVTYVAFTRDRDYGDSAPFAGARAGEVVRFHERNVMYVDIARPAAYLRALRRFTRIDHDVYYFNSAWNRPFTLVPLALISLGVIARRPVLLAPRGELMRGALDFKGWRKRAGLLVLRVLLARVGATIHCTSEEEAASVRKHLPGRPIELVADAFEAEDRLPAPQPDAPTPSDTLRVCFFSRIDRKKNLTGVLAAMAQVTEPVHLRVIGPASDQAYEQRCRDMAAKLPGHIRVEFMGPVPHEQAADALSWAHVFFFPTKAENFGHVVREAMAAGLCPVISDTTPWTDLARRAGGVALPWADTNGFARHLSVLARTPSEELGSLRAKVLDTYRSWAASQVPSPVLMDRLFERLAREPAAAPGVVAAVGPQRGSAGAPASQPRVGGSALDTDEHHDRHAPSGGR
ncbi:glycosyltransferase [Micromonospora sp. PLK6-60]|uniref:glycosyltransferase n=1 Tax=Micromonospora sp. PLK6-60 TaxID=2873383 RepID=UPI001CA66A22|nr:glycosyltransferase [Micromonospora sp. PLK6-60]MBY8874823.1 glycosyltransferase [Micromonospora sp. PLK6-60]